MKLVEILVEIRSKRESLGFTQNYMASKLNISQSSYNKLENGTVEMTLARFLEIATILDINEKDLVRYTRELKLA